MPCSHGDYSFTEEKRVSKNKCEKCYERDIQCVMMHTRGAVPNFIWIRREGLHQEALCFKLRWKGLRVVWKHWSAGRGNSTSILSEEEGRIIVCLGLGYRQPVHGMTEVCMEAASLVPHCVPNTEAVPKCSSALFENFWDFLSDSLEMKRENLSHITLCHGLRIGFNFIKNNTSSKHLYFWYKFIE